MSLNDELAIDRELRVLVVIAVRKTGPDSEAAINSFVRIVQRLQRGWSGFRPATPDVVGPPEWSILDTSFELLATSSDKWPERKKLFRDAYLALQPDPTATTVLQSWRLHGAGLGLP